ncbi:MAG: hypothetical protein ABJN69_08130 [Hellea sp.]
MKTSIAFGLILFTVFLAACADGVSVSKSKSETLAEASPLQDSFTTPVFKLTTNNNSRVTLFGIKNCHVYKAAQTEGRRGDWELLFKPAPYALPKMCIVERLEMEGDYLHIEIGTQAMGAGGCCTTYAAYRTLDGETWDIRPATSITTWQRLDISD